MIPGCSTRLLSESQDRNQQSSLLACKGEEEKKKSTEIDFISTIRASLSRNNTRQQQQNARLLILSAITVRVDICDKQTNKQSNERALQSVYPLVGAQVRVRSPGTQ